MGQQQTKPKENDIVLPINKHFKLSYNTHETIKVLAEKKEHIDFSTLVQDFHSFLILRLIYQKLHMLGYTFKEHYWSSSQTHISKILDVIKEDGILINNELFNDFDMSYTCYEPTLNNVYSFLNEGKILVAGIILTEPFVKEYFNKETNTTTSDIVLIVGYDTHTFFIKTIWCEQILKIPNTYIKNIRELWNIEIKGKDY